MKWVTREFVHVDRTACPWLIRRFIDPEAEFIFAPVEKVLQIVEKEKAIPYDVQGVELGHRGDRCSFDAIVEKYGLKDPALLGVAVIVRAADTGKMELAPEAAGLEAIMSGISMAAKDDHEAVEKARIVYDALYINRKMKLVEKRSRAEVEKMSRSERREFLKKEIEKTG